MGMTELDSKRARYGALVGARKTCRACADPANPSVCEGGAFDCEAIGAWSRWQGNADAQVMVVGQDWGDVDCGAAALHFIQNFEAQFEDWKRIREFLSRTAESGPLPVRT